MFCWKFAVLGSVREILRYPIGKFLFFSNFFLLFPFWVSVCWTVWMIRILCFDVAGCEKKLFFWGGVLVSVLGIGRESRCGVGEEEGEVGLNYMDCLCFFNSVSQVRISPPFSISFFIFLMYWYIFQVFVFVDLLILDLKKKKKLEKAYDLSRYVATFVVDLEILCGLFKFSERVGFVNDKIRKIMLLFLV